MDAQPNTLTSLFDSLAEIHGARSIGYGVLRKMFQHVARGLAELGVGLGDDDLARHCESLAILKRPVRFVVLDVFPVTKSANGVKIQRPTCALKRKH